MHHLQAGNIFHQSRHKTLVTLLKKHVSFLCQNICSFSAKIFFLLCIKILLFRLNDMSKDYTQKVRNILNQSNQTVPYIFERFYTLLKLITLSIPHQNTGPKVFEQYSLIYRTIKRWIVDEPYSLMNNNEKIEKQLKALLNPLLIFMNEDPLAKKILEYFLDKNMGHKITAFINDADKIKSQLLAKNLKIKVFGTHEMSNAFWLRKFRNEYAVHVDSFWNCFLEFIMEIDFFDYFVSASSKKSIMKKVDPQRKYFVTSTNVSQLFYKLSEPRFLQHLADETAKGNKAKSFQSKDFLDLRFSSTPGSVFETILKQGKKGFEISGEDTLIGGHRVKIRNPPTVIFGSSVDSDIKIKNKYVSRKQFMIIEEEENTSASQSPQLPFSLVCLSSSNFTMVSYNRVEKLRAGMIFKIGENSVQVVKVSHCLIEISKASQAEDSDNDQTLEYLPNKANTEVSSQRQLEYLCISGPFKGRKGKITKENLKFSQELQNIQSLKVEYREDEFYLPEGTKILVKTANQVINGQLSDKISIEEGMKIILEECQFQVL